MRLTKIYTKVGDKGSTLLATGERVLKTSTRIEAYGTVDELNAFVGVLGDELRVSKGCDSILSQLHTIQNELFDIGGELATPSKHLDITKQQVVTAASVKRLEDEIDIMNAGLPPLANFVLPGGHRANSAAHVARTVCRRAEREVFRLAEKEEVREDVRIYLNRLSDWFFVAGRAISSQLGVNEVLWSQKR